jgi:hypothetical protein
MITIQGERGPKESLLIEELKRRGYVVEVKSDDEDIKELDLGELIDKYTDTRRMWSFEGSRGVRYLKDIIQVLDHNYRDFDEFFSDNSGAIIALLEYIKEAKVREWRDNFEKAVSELE